MGITAKLSGSNALKIKTGTGTGGAGGDVTISSGITQNTPGTLGEIGNVNDDARANNAVLVFNNETNRYEVKPLPSAAIDEDTIEGILAQGNVNMDGGTF
jgi:hypothetical protein